ncbi:GNAT family N-acetyltransferase [Streptomyces microflavus]|uniref:GNAT family N-acetyltransferase n=1 Tax=Streptomyces microflavus TaxID=1919 RepID=UPI0036AD4867
MTTLRPHPDTPTTAPPPAEGDFATPRNTESAAANACVLSRTAVDEANETWILLHDGDLLTAFVDIIDCGHELWISDIAVHPDYRSRGLASRLLNAVIHENPGAHIALSCSAFTVEDVGEWPRGAAGLTTEALAAWYTRYGFSSDPHEDDADRMTRAG